jgi:hypothetical protein
MVVEDGEHRQVRRRHRLEEPLLAERPRPEALHVRHVGVQDEREPARRGRAHGRQTATKSSAPSRGRSARSAKSDVASAGVKRS